MLSAPCGQRPGTRRNARCFSGTSLLKSRAVRPIAIARNYGSIDSVGPAATGAAKGKSASGRHASRCGNRSGEDKVASSTHGTVRSFAFLVSTICALVALFALAGNAGAATRTGGTGTSPWIASELPDYPPGALVNLMGGSWDPGESVHINVNDNDGQSWDRDVDVTADVNGDVSDSFTLPDWFVATDTVTATAASGSAVTTFTDAQPASVTVAAPTSATVTAGNAATYGNVSVTMGGNATSCTVTLVTRTLAGDSGLPAGASAVFGNSPVTGSGNFTSSISVN